MSDGSGPPLCAPLATFDREWRCMRILQQSLPWEEESLGAPYSPPWPKSGMWDGGGVYEQAMSEHLTDVSGYSSSPLLPTPSATYSHEQNPDIFLERRERVRQQHNNGNGFGLSLGMTVRLLPTPAAQEPGGTVEAHLWRKNRHDGGNRVTPTHLSFIVKELLPTPTTDDANNITRASGDYQSLAREVHQLLPTPTARDWKGENQRSDDTCLPGAVARLLPTPTSADGLGGHLTRGGERSDEMLLGGVAKAAATGRLLPTPTASDAKSSGGYNPDWGHGTTLTDAIKWRGEPTGPPSPDGSPSEDQHPTLFTEEA